ncbi:MAG: hypothetical protein ACOX0Z_01250 [Candidatus Nanosyncoccaceae bacterium]|jgi:uncharacterized membrane protein
MNKNRTKLSSHNRLLIVMAMFVITLVSFISVPTTIVHADDNKTSDYAILNPPSKEGGISYLLGLIIKILTGLVAVAAVTSIIFAGVQYASAGDSPEKVKAAKDRITQTVIGLLLYIFMFTILEFLIPGGILGIGAGGGEGGGEQGGNNITQSRMIGYKEK